MIITASVPRRAHLPGRVQFDYRAPPAALAELLAEENLAVHLGFDGLAFDDVPLGEWAETPPSSL